MVVAFKIVRKYFFSRKTPAKVYGNLKMGLNLVTPKCTADPEKSENRGLKKISATAQPCPILTTLIPQYCSKVGWLQKSAHEMCQTADCVGRILSPTLVFLHILLLRSVCISFILRTFEIFYLSPSFCVSCIFPQIGY